MTTEVGTLQFKTETRDIVRAEKEIARLEKEVAKIEKSQQRAAAQAVKLSSAKYKVAASAAKASKEFKAVGFEFMKVNIEAKKTAQAVTQVEAATEQATRSMDKLEAVAMKGRGGFRAMRGSTAQLGMQIQDMAVQASMGTNSLIILGQQGPQIASLFGPGGAILGAFIAVGAAVANLGFGLGRTSEDIDKLAEASKGLEKVMSRTEQGAFGLTSQIRELAERSKELASIELAIGIANAKIQFNEAKNSIIASTTAITTAVNTSAESFERYGNAGSLLRDADAQLRSTGERVDELKERFGLSTKEAVRFAAAFARFRADRNEENMAALRDVVEGLSTTLSDKANPELRDLLVVLNDAFIKGQDATDALAAYRQGLDWTGDAAKESAEKLEESIVALELKAKVVGMTARQEALYRAELNKAGDAEKARINAAYDKIDAYKEEIEKAKEKSKQDKADIKLANEEAALTSQFAKDDIKRLDQQQRAREQETKARDRALQAAYEYAQGIIAMNDTEQEAFDRMITNKRTKLEEDYKAGLILEAEYQAAKTELIEAEANRAAEVEKKIAAERTKALLQMEDVFMSGKSDRAKAAYRLGVNLMNQEKRDNAERIISESYVAAMKAYSALAKINIVGPALGAAAAAAVLATGATYAAGALTGRALGGQVRPGESYIVGERGPEVLTMGNAGGRVATNESMRGSTSLVYSPTVNISGGATEQDRALFTAQLRQQKAEIADLLARRRF